MKFHSKFIKAFAIILSTCIFLTACSLPFNLPSEKRDNYNSDEKSERRLISYSDMVYKRPDTAAIKAVLTDYTQKSTQAASFDEIEKMDEELTDLIENLYTMKTLAELKKYHDITDEDMEEEYRFLEDESVEIGNLVNDWLRAIVEGPFAEDYRKELGDFAYQSVLNNLRLNSKEVEAFKKERTSLNTDYNKQLATLSLNFDGQEMTLDDILEVEDVQKRFSLIGMLYETNLANFSQMYLKMVELDKQTAETLGFDSAAEMYYLGYGRDYSPKKALELCEDVKEIFAPMTPEVLYYSAALDDISMSKTLEKMPEALGKVDAQLVKAWDDMINFGLYDFEALPNKNKDVAFTTSLQKYDAPFCFVYWKDNVGSATTIMHEFGHFYDKWLRHDDDVVFNLDMAEIYSQGLELLMHKELNQFTKQATEAKLESLRGFLQAITYQALYEEFQQKIYAMNSPTADDVSKIYTELLIDYGFGDYALPGENSYDNSWFTMTHIFDAPFYTISYTTSALMSLQIWAQSQDNWSNGTDVYLKLIHADQNQPFKSLVESVGLRDTDNLQMLYEVAGYFMKSFNLKEEDLVIPNRSLYPYLL